MNKLHASFNKTILVKQENDQYICILFTQLDISLSVEQTKTDTFANSVDPDEMACNKPTHKAVQC